MKLTLRMKLLTGFFSLLVLTLIGQTIMLSNMGQSTGGLLVQLLSENAILLVVEIAVAIGIVFLLEKSILKSIDTLRHTMKRAGEGDLTVRSQSQTQDEFGELADSFNTMIDSQDKIVRQVSTASDQLSAASE